jgi:hypothetical protein
MEVVIQPVDQVMSCIIALYGLVVDVHLLLAQHVYQQEQMLINGF